MKIKRFVIQGFKSIDHLIVDDLADVNVFYGQNDVGKSNIFEALTLLQHVFQMAEKSKQVKWMPPDHLFRLGGEGHIDIWIDIEFDKETWHKSDVYKSVKNKRLTFNNEIDAILVEADTFTITAICGLRAGSESISRSTHFTINEKRFSVSPEKIFPLLHMIKAERRFQQEQWSKANNLGAITDENLKQALFYAYLSREPQQKQRLSAIRHLLVKDPFRMGELDVALDPETQQIDIGFVYENGRLPIENLGSGSQQLLLMLGQVFLNDYPIVALEEPEMNLSPFYQEHLLSVLRELMADTAVSLNQLFISTHSPYLEFQENSYLVTRDETGATQVIKSTAQKHTDYFALSQVGPDTGARLNSLNQVELYEGVVEDLALERGDLVIFVRNENGRWEIRSAREVAQTLQTITDNGNN
ncbi:MAG: AAA family ATPase [Chloroflexota bacterium]